MHVPHCVRKHQQELPFRNSDSSWHFSRPHFLEGGRNIWFFWNERHFEEQCGKKKLLCFLKFFPCIMPTQSKSVWRKPRSICLVRGTSVATHSSSQQTSSTSPCSSFPLQFTCCSPPSLSLSPHPLSSPLPCLNLPFCFLTFSSTISFHSYPPQSWLFCSHSEHVQRPVLEIGIKGARLRLGRQSKGVGQGPVSWVGWGGMGGGGAHNPSVLSHGKALPQIFQSILLLFFFFF